MSDLYDADILQWSERQAALLRRVAARDRLNEDSPDWPNIIEEIESAGREQLHAVESLLGQAIRHMLKAEGWPLSPDAPVWRSDAIDFRRQSRRRYVPSMRQKIDVAALYADALAAMPGAIDGRTAQPVPSTCALTLEDLLGDG